MYRSGYGMGCTGLVMVWEYRSGNGMGYIGVVKVLVVLMWFRNGFAKYG
jgi:hypothetical protein